MSELDAFREEARAWVVENAPKSLYGTRKGKYDGYWGGRLSKETNPDVLRWCELNADRGWTAPEWPTKYGGGGLSRAQATVINDILAERKLPSPLVGFGFTMIGPTLLDFGTEAQKMEHLPKICRGEVRWCQGYSEPSAGSDLAGLSTRAVADGDAFLVNGQKVWTSYANKSDWIYCLTRTNPDVKKQAGITFMLIDMLQDGITTREIDLISGWSPFCEVFIDNVRVPNGNIVGEVDKGWTVAKALLGYERSSIGDSISGGLAGQEECLVADARDAIGQDDDGPLADAALRREIAMYAMDEQCLGLTNLRLAEASRTGKPGAESSIMKIAGSEIKQRRWELATEIFGPQSLGWEGEGFAPDELTATKSWLRSRAASIEGGTSEIQLNVIAKRVLGLG